MDVEPIAARHQAVLERLVEVARRDDRVVAAWLQGSRADGSEDPFSDIDFYLAVADDAFITFDKLAFVSQVAPVLVHAEPFPGIVVCLLEGPVKLDLTAERSSAVAHGKRPAARMLLDKADVSFKLQTGWEPEAQSIARQVDDMLRMTFQGATWPVRLLRRGQWATHAFTEMALIVGTIVPLMLVERDRRAFARNSISRERLLTTDERHEIDSLTGGVLRAIVDRSLPEAYRAHLSIAEVLGRVGRRACARFALEFPEAAEQEALRFYEREWPR